MRRASSPGAGLILLLGLAMLGGGCESPEPPENPSWDIDVYPILRGSCLHCHGDTFQSAGTPLRFDVCDTSASEFRTLGVSNIGLGAASLAAVILESLKTDKGRPRMPPPPAAPLDAYQTEIIRRWVPLAMRSPQLACRKRVPNQPPQVKLIGAPRVDLQSLWVTLEVIDADGDQVMGRVTAGKGSTDLTFMGRKSVEIRGATASDVGSIKATVTDGWVTTTSSF